MRVDDAIRKCVCFVGYKLADDSFRFAGSAFWLGNDVPGTSKSRSVHVVTAKHVVESIAAKGLSEVWLRLNHLDGSSRWIATDLENWATHDSDRSIDVSVLRLGIPNGFDHLVFPQSLCISPEKMRENDVGLGEEVYVVGLFRHHHGNKKNIPIVRVGNLASVGEEKIFNSELGEMDAILIEARSIGGLSGSPVFLNLGRVRVVGGRLVFAQGHMEFLLGLVHGHFDTPKSVVDAVTQDDRSDISVERVNTGIAVVVPVHSILAVIESVERR
jgi:hypothetical protein